MKELKLLNKKRMMRKKRTRAKIFGTAARPRFSVYRSNHSIFAQIIDDENNKTLTSVNMKELSDKNKKTKSQQAEMLGALIANKAKAKGINKVVFDKSYYKFHGRVKSIADGARKTGLDF